ncbi:MAG TPA: MFS transporter [Jatrophihabitans sp.]
MAVSWALLADTVPLYSLYALLFGHVGLSSAAISGLFVFWSLVAVSCEIPSGALADQFSRRGALIAAGVLQASGYALWVSWPALPSFAAGFALWGIAGSLVSGALEALLYDGLAEVGAQAHFGTVLGRITAAQLIAQIPAAVAASVLYSVGGFALAGWVSVGCCLTAALFAARLPEPPRTNLLPRDGARGESAAGYWSTVHDGMRQVGANAAVRAAVLAVALVAGIDAIDEYFPLLVQHWGVPTGLNPIVVLAIPLAGAAGAAMGGSVSAGRSGRLAALLAVSASLLAAAGLFAHPLSVVAVAAFYALYRWVLIVIEARLQAVIVTSARATVTSVAAVGVEVGSLALFASWALGGVMLVAAELALIAAVLPRLLRRTGSSPDAVS